MEIGHNLNYFHLLKPWHEKLLSKVIENITSKCPGQEKLRNPGMCILLQAVMCWLYRQMNDGSENWWWSDNLGLINEHCKWSVDKFLSNISIYQWKNHIFESVECVESLSGGMIVGFFLPVPWLWVPSLPWYVSKVVITYSSCSCLKLFCHHVILLSNENMVHLEVLSCLQM